MFPKNSLSPLLPKAPFWKIQVATQKPADPILPSGKPINCIHAFYATLSESKEVVNIAKVEGL